MTSNLEKENTESKVDYKGVIPKNPFSFLIYISKANKHLAIIATTVVIIASVLHVFSALFVKQIVDLAQAGQMKYAILVGLAYPVYIFLVESLWRLSSVPGRKWVARSRQYVVENLMEYSLDHSHNFFINNFAGSLLSKVGNVVRGTEKLIIDFLLHHLEGVVGMLAYSYLIISIDLSTGITFVLLVMSVTFLNYKLVPRKQVWSRKLADSDTYLRGQIVDVFTNIVATRQYSQKKFERDRINSTISDNSQIFENSWWYSEWMRILNSLLLLVFSLAIFFLLSIRWEAGDISTGEFVAVMVMLFSVTERLVFIGRVFNDTATSYGEVAEALDVILSPYEVVDSEKSKKLKVKSADIKWDNVTFEYGANKVFKKFNLNIKAGERIGLVGPSGAGKTTFVSLMLRQHDLNEGSIQIDGQDIAKVTQDSLRESIAVVPQEPLLFHRTIRENIAYGKPGATMEEIIAVAKKAQAHKFISSLPEGYDTLVGERGVKLSGGQKQRVAIARAMLKDAPILILDEATSALDSESEVAIQKALHQLMRGKTVIAIAHRLSTLREMDRIIVLEGGKIVEDGSHEVLSKAGGTYQRLWEHQAGGFLTE